jgi:hypothetical protein
VDPSDVLIVVICEQFAFLGHFSQRQPAMEKEVSSHAKQVFKSGEGWKAGLHCGQKRTEFFPTMVFSADKERDSAPEWSGKLTRMECVALDAAYIQSSATKDILLEASVVELPRTPKQLAFPHLPLPMKTTTLTLEARLQK